MKFRTLQSTDIAFLEELLYMALHVAPGNPPYPKSIIHSPELNKYIHHWGSRKCDIGFVAYDDQTLVGGIWGRLFVQPEVGYGYIDDQTPEISMAIKPKYRNMGLGTELLQRLIDQYKKEGFHTLSLSVDKTNRAVGLYERMGFKIWKKGDTSYTMRCTF